MNYLLAALRSVIVVALLTTWASAQTEQSALIESWASTALRAEEVLETRLASTDALEVLRTELVGQRAEASAMEKASLLRIEPLKAELSALGPEPLEGEIEAFEIASRRSELNVSITNETVPLLVAQAAWKRSDKLVREINSLIRSRFSENLVEQGPMPFSPAFLPIVYNDLNNYADRLVGELNTAFNQETSRATLKEKAPLAILLAGIGLWLLLGVRKGFANIVQKALVTGEEERLWQSALTDLARLMAPAAGAVAVILALEYSGFVGVWGDAIIKVLPEIAIALIGAPWLGRIIFRNIGQNDAASHSGNKAAGVGYRMSVTLGVVYALSTLLIAMSDQGDFSRETGAVLNFPLVIIAAFAFFRLAKVFRRPRSEGKPDDTAKEPTVILFAPLIARFLFVFAIVAPLLAALGYFAASRFLVFPTIQTLALMAGLLVLYNFIRALLDFWIVGESQELRRDQTQLVPVFFGFLLSACAVPVIALIWGARTSDLIEIWGWLREGVSIGESKFSLTDFLVFVLVFGVGYTVTRLFQKTIRTSVLPRTKMDVGGKSAILAGIGYVGLTIAALAAVSATGLDLSSLAIVAGALSVGIGFGLQTIVSNFVSGIILLIERPIKEGDWIIAGGHEGVVRKISVRATLVDTFDRCAVIIPNSDLIAASVQNWNSPDQSGRIRLPIGVAYGTDPERVREILLEIANGHPLALKYPAPAVIFGNFGASSLDFELRIFIRDIGKSLTVRSDVNFSIAKRFEEEGIEIPFAQQDIRLKNLEEIGATISDAIQGKPTSKNTG